MKCSQLIDDLQHAKEKLEHEKDDQNKLLEKKSGNGNIISTVLYD